MSCDVKYDDIIFTIYKKSRISKDEYNVFIGKVDSKIEVILKKLEKRDSTITKDDQIKLKLAYPKYFTQWINIVKNKNINMKFINIKIHIDDNISDIRKKIFVYMSDIEKKNYILPENIELWLEKEDKSTELIGYYYENKNTSVKENFKPSIYESINLKLLETKMNYNDLKKNISENNILIYDLLNQDKYIKNIIYICDAKDDEKYFNKLKIKIKDSIINNYFKKYWLYVNLNYDISEIHKSFIIMKDYYDKELYINNLIQNSTVNNSIFGSCNIQTIYFKVADDINTQKEEVDLFQILDYLKDNQLNEKMPYIKYSEESFDNPFILISKKAILDGHLDKNILSEWLGLNEKDDLKKVNGLSLKRYSKDYNNKPKYYSVLLNKYGVLQITVSYLNENKASFSDVEYAIDDCSKFIDSINKNRIVKKINEKSKIQLPEFKYKDGNILTNKFTNIIFMIISIPLNLEVPLDFNKLYEFSKKFPYFIVDTPKNILKKDKPNKEETSLKIRYKRISGFVNMNDILLDIDKLKEKSIDNGLIIKILQKKYDRSIEEIKSYIIEWEKKYSSSKSTKISSEFKQGILITITNSKILVHGITKTYQISLIYKFFTTFLNLFINYDNYIKNKDFKKIFTGKNINENVEMLENSYEYNNNVVLNIEKINYTNYDIDEFYNNNESTNNNYYDEEELNNENKVNITQLTPKIEGLASLNDVGTDIVLKCDDAIPEKATCEDFCNDDYYFIRRLQLYDIKLFKPNKGIKGKYEKYTKSCQAKRQPVVLAFDPENDPRIKRESYTYAIKYSSDPNTFQRWYICPKIWCPYCEIPISENDVDKSTMKLRATKEKSRICKTVLCPYGNHLAYVKDKDTENEVYPGFISKSIHPNGLCLPCCFKKPKNKPKTIDYIRMKKCMGEENEYSDIKIKDSQIYILGKGVPIDTNRYGKLNLELERLLKTNLDTGYLGNKSGYLRKGITHLKNNSFLSAISDIISCDKKNINIDVKKLKSIILDKIDDNLFQSIYQGNLPNVFFDIDNFKKYILNENIIIEHKYLWDLLQRENILTEEGLNIFIFENNNLICPKGENINFFYDKNKKSILLFKYNNYYEPIYYLEGNGKSAKITCLFDYDKEEIKKIFDISMEGCKDYYDIDWIDVLKHNMEKYNFKVDNLTISNGYDLQTLLNGLLLSIKNKKLNQTFLPKLQYIDGYYKVFGIMLVNGLYIPISPSKLNDKIEYKIAMNMNDINKLNVKNTIKFTEEISKNTNIKLNIKFKILDLKKNKIIIALLNEYNRFIPVLHENDNLKSIKVANINYFSDVDQYLNYGDINLDNRIEIMNKKKFEDETYMRLKFELSKFIQYKENKKYYDKILEIVNSDTKDIVINRSKMLDVLNSIFKLLISTKNHDIDYYRYKTPNKRVPCSIRSITKTNNNTIKLGCNDDLHCINVGKECKLYVNKINLVDTDRKINNYDFYISKIIDELLRFKLKRNEILNDNIPIIIDKKIITENIKKYVVIKTNNREDIKNIVEKLFLDTNGILIDTQNLYEDTSTNNIGFKKNKYLKVRIKNLNESKSDDLSTYWIKIFGYNYTVKLNTTDSLLYLLLNVVNLSEFKNNRSNKTNNKLFEVNDLKNSIIEYINNKKNKSNILSSYSKNKYFKNIPDIELIKEKILNEDYKGSEVDLNIISQIFNINFIILDKRSKKNNTNIKMITSKNFKSDYFVLLYKTKIVDSFIYNLVQNKSKIIFKFNTFPPKFVKLLDNLNIVNNNGK